MRQSLLSTLFVSAALAAASSGAPQVEPFGQIEGEEVGIRIVAMATEADGATTEVGSAGSTLPVGGSGASTVMAGEYGPDGRAKASLCMSLTGSGSSFREVDRTAPHAWFVRYRVRSASIDEITLEVDWEYYSSPRREQAVRDRGDLRTITLREGEHHVLDFIDEPQQADGSTCYRNLTIVLEARIEEDPALTSRMIAYQAWFSEAAEGGPALSRYAEARGGQGTRVDLHFDSLRFPISGVVTARGREAEVVADLLATVRGRVRANGDLEVRVEGTRWLSAVPAGDMRRGGTGDGGAKRVRFAPGETVRLVLPAPSGRTILNDHDGPVASGTERRRGDPRTADRAGTPPAVERGPDGTITVHFAPFFRGRTFSLTLRATAL